MGVAEDFAVFRQNYIISKDTISSIGRRYRTITRRLNLDFWNTDSETSHSLYVGSYGRDTASCGISDLDVGFVLPNALYQQYDAHLGNGQSQLLQAVRNSIRKTYSTSDAFGDGQVVVIAFDDGITFEVLPAFINTAGSWTHPNSNGGGSWGVTNPRAEIDAIHNENLAANGNLKSLARMMRRWKYQNSVPISGWLIDTLSYQFIKSWSYKDKSFLYHDYMARDFFAFMAAQSTTQSYWRAPGSGSYVPTKGNFQRPANTAHALALKAIQQRADGYEWASRQTWRTIFGTTFPS